jgi:hypothetical protein
MNIKKCCNTLQKTSDTINTMYNDIDKTKELIAKTEVDFQDEYVSGDLIDVLGDLFEAMEHIDVAIYELKQFRGKARKTIEEVE